jgi:transposase
MVFYGIFVKNEKKGKVGVSRKNLNLILKESPQVKEYYSMCVQLTRDEVREAYKSFFAFRKKGSPNIKHQTFVGKTICLHLSMFKEVSNQMHFPFFEPPPV